MLDRVGSFGCRVKVQGLGVSVWVAVSATKAR